MPSISVIIPVYNVVEHLEQCVTSAMNQSFDDIEIICVDDGSQDGSAELLGRLCEQDNRMRVITHNVNESRLRSRKDGVAASCGDFIMFLDGDDYLASSACELAYRAIQESQSDVVQFGTIVENCSSVPESRIRLNERAMKPYHGDLAGESLLVACFCDHKFNFTLWNKIYRGDLLRNVFSQMEDCYISKASDMYASFLLLSHAKSYSAIDDSLYHYCFGRGMTGRNEMSLEDYKAHCAGADAIKALERWVSADGFSGDDEHRRALESAKKSLLGDIVARWRDNLSPHDRYAGLEYLCSVWPGGFPFVLAGIANSMYYMRSEASGALTKLIERSCQPRTVKVVKNLAFYYHSIRGGGAQRVVAELSSMFAELEDSGERCYNVVLITDGKPAEDDFPVPDSVTREYLPHYTEFPERDYRDRIEAWYSILDRHHIDVVVDSMWIAPVFMWDMLAVKAHHSHPAVVAHVHNCFGTVFAQTGDALGEMGDTYRLVDAVVCLSKVDQAFWSRINERVSYIANPVAFPPSPVARIAENGGHMIWVGRLSDVGQKQPFEAYRIMREICYRTDDVTCHFVGDGDEGLVNELTNAIEKDGLSGRIVLEGYQPDIRPWYEQASVFLLTSRYEGYPLVLYEAAAHGIPTVMYDIPWLEYRTDIRGWKSVPMNDYRAAADEVERFLRDDKLWTESSRALVESYEVVAKHDIVADWIELFDSLQYGDTARKRELSHGSESSMLSIIIDEICEFHRECIERNKQAIQQAYDEKSELSAKLQRTYDEKSELNATLQRTYDEKSELGAKLQKTYDEKAERGVQIWELNRKIDQLRKEKKALKRRLVKARDGEAKVKQSRSYIIGRKITSPARVVGRLRKMVKR